MSYRPRFWKEPRKTVFTSEVKEVMGNEIVLDNTYFHPEEGGQPADKGTIEGYKVIDLKKEGEKIFHLLDQKDHGLEVGKEVKGDINDDFRYYCMRAHTGAHIVYGSGRKVLKEIDYAGFDISEKKVRIDFETETHVDKRTLLKMEELCNKVILENRNVRWKILDKKQVEKSDEIAFAKEIPRGKKVRIIEVEDWDRGVCSGTHLNNTLEVGRIRIHDKKKLQEGVTRITFSIGDEALTKDYKEKRSVLRALDILETGSKDLPKKVRHLKRKLKKMEKKVKELESKKIEEKLQNFERYDKGDFDLLVQILSTDDTDMLSHKAKDEVEDEEVIILINERETLSAVIGVGDEIESVSAEGIIQKAKEEFGGGGGGTNKFAQGGGFNTSSEEMKRFLIEKL